MSKKYIGLILILMAVSAESSDLNIKSMDSPMELLVHKTPTCGCCKMWVNTWKIMVSLLGRKIIKVLRR